MLCPGKRLFCNKARLHHLEWRCFRRGVCCELVILRAGGNKAACPVWRPQNLLGVWGIYSIKEPQGRESIVSSDRQARCEGIWMKIKFRGKIPTGFFGAGSSCPCRVKINHPKNTTPHLTGERQQEDSIMGSGPSHTSACTSPSSSGGSEKISNRMMKVNAQQY